MDHIFAKGVEIFRHILLNWYYWDVHLWEIKKIDGLKYGSLRTNLSSGLYYLRGCIIGYDNLFG